MILKLDLIQLFLVSQFDTQSLQAADEVANEESSGMMMAGKPSSSFAVTLPFNQKFRLRFLLTLPN